MSGIDFGSVIGDFGGAVGDLFGSAGSSTAAKAYGKEAAIARDNAAISKVSGQIQEAQQQRVVTQALGTEVAQTAGAGFTQSGSALDLMRSSVQQGALSKQLIANQATITTQGYLSQAEAATGQEQAAKTAAKGQGIGGIFKAALGVAGLFGL